MTTYLELVADAGIEPELRDVAGYVTDVLLLYELELVRPPGDPEEWIAPVVLLSRHGRRVEPELRLRISELHLASPLVVKLLIPVLKRAAVAANAVAVTLAHLDRPSDHGRTLPSPNYTQLDLERDRVEIERAQLRPGMSRLPGEAAGPQTRPWVLVRGRLQRSFRTIEVRVFDEE